MGFGTTYKSQANPILSASLILAIDLWDSGCAGPRALRTVRIGAYRCAMGICTERILFLGGYGVYLNTGRALCFIEITSIPGKAWAHGN